MNKLKKTQETQPTGGNTYTPVNTLRSRKWCLTLNNYTDDEYNDLLEKTQNKCKFWIIGKEIGENKTPHLQCYIECKHQVKFTTIKNWNNRLHIEKAKGSKKQNFDYCSKESNYETNIDMETIQEKMKKEILRDEYNNVVWKDWQQEVLNIIDKKPNKRSIYWYWEETGNVGKSYLCKWLTTTKNVILCSGKSQDIFNQLKQSIDNKIIPRIILCDIPRYNIDYINYGALEKLKDGCLYSGKYEGAQISMPIPHVICFANQEPDLTAMSKDRWAIKKI